VHPAPGAVAVAAVYDRREGGAATWFHAIPESVQGAQALLLARAFACHALAQWESVTGWEVRRLARLAAHVGPIHYHRPSLVQHTAATSSWGTGVHRALDFDENWRAGEAARAIHYTYPLSAVKRRFRSLRTAIRPKSSKVSSKQ
jgi:hypothetical protein